ncbi:MAG: DEAD/DEAH box helicase, partial [Verrucomicrobiia bacterium]
PEKFIPWLRSLPKHMEVRLDQQLATLLNEPLSASLRLDATSAGMDWFDLRVAVDVGKTELTPEELNMLLKARGGYVRLGAKGWQRLKFSLSAEDDERLARLGLGSEDFDGEPQRLHVLQLADTAATRFLPEARVVEIRRRAGELQTRVTPPVPAVITGQLRPYQVEGFHFLCYLSTNRFGGILADDMGLGKTLQALAWLAWLRASLNGKHRPSLVICPKSVMDNWRAEATRFFPGLRVNLWRGVEPAALTSALADADLFVINYSQLRILGNRITEVEWHAALLDEGQYIKNPESQTARVARALRADHRLVLTGTPIENRLLDLWSLMAFAMPGVLGNRAQFAKRHNQVDDPLASRRLSARVRPFLLRRTKSEVASDLPDRIEEDLLCEMEGAQQTLYRAEFKSAQQMLLKIKTTSDFDRQRFNFLRSLLRLRQICCHPALVDPKQGAVGGAKIEALVDLLDPLIEEGHKVLVFSQFVSLINLLKPVVREKGWKSFVLTGATENRGALVADFQNTQGPAIFLISLRAGGFGLNLTAASYVVLFDPWWNPAVENQAIDRAHRIGQTNKVMAYRLLIKDSIEEKIRALQRAKFALAEDVLGEGKFSKSLTLDDLRFLFADAPPP